MKQFFSILFIAMIASNGLFVPYDQLQMVGLLFDILGVYFLSQGFITKSLQDVVEESREDEDKPYLGALKDNYSISLYIQAIEAKTGFILLFIGFTLQGVAHLFKDFVIPYHIGTLALLLTLLAINITHKKLFVYNKILKKIESAETEIDHAFWKEIYEEQEKPDESNNT